MDSNLFSLSKIFTERLFRIPDYQRGYAWSDKQLKDFWNDLCLLEEGKNHYTGVLTLEDIPPSTYKTWTEDLWIIESKSYSPHYIVDGQQRMTTSIILIECIIETIEEGEMLNFNTKSEIQKKFIFDTKDKGISRSYIFGYEEDNPSYNFLKTKIFLEETETKYSLEETIYTHNLEGAKEFFKDRLKELKKVEVEGMYKKLTQHFLFNIYSISEDIDVFVAFETMNNRGKPLSHLELLKNRLIFLSTKFKTSESDKKTLRIRINECWKAIYHNLGRNKENPLNDDIFLVNHFVLFFGSEVLGDSKGRIRYSRLTNRMMHTNDYSTFLLEKKFTTKNLQSSTDQVSIEEVDTYVKDLQASVVSWFKLFNPEKSDYTKDVKYWLAKINRQGMLKNAPLILSYFQKEKVNKKRVDFLKLLERRNFFESMMTGYFYREYISESNLELAIILKEGKIDKDKIVRTLENQLVRLRTEKEVWTTIVKSFRSDGFYNWRGIRYFLFEYDLHLKEGSKTSRVKLKWDEFNNEDYDTVEHIYPQRGRKNCWTTTFSSFSDKERKILKNSLGNLLPLSRPKNSSLSNNCFVDKIGKEGTTIGFRYGCYAENKVTEYSDWNAKNIKSRGLELLEFMEERWQIKVGSEKEKTFMLGLEFVK